MELRAAQYAQSRESRLSPARRLHILVAAAGLAGAVSTQAAGVYFQNSFGLLSPSNHVTFSEYSPPPNTVITTQYQAFGVTFVPSVRYASIFNQTSGTPNIDPTACVANFIQFSPPVSTFSIVFGRPVSAAAFAVLTQPGTFRVTALWGGIALPGGPATFTGGFGPDRTTNFVGLSGVTFDELRVSNIATSDGALVLDNLQFTPVLVNNWTNPTSARWDSITNWSLHSLPASNQTVYINNGGFKGVNVDSATFANFPDSVTVSNLLVAAPRNALSTLLLNFTGLNAPLKALNSCAIGANGTIDNFSSWFEVDGNDGGQLLVDGGNFTQVGGLTVVNAPVLVRNNGSLNATNGNLTLGDVTLGATDSTGSFNQDGGSIAAQEVTVQNGRYTLVSGTLYAIGGTEIDGFGEFLQWGGTNFGDITINADNSPDTYTMDGGLAQGNVLTIRGRFFQGGGVVDMQTVDWTGHEGDVLSLGTLRSKVINVHSNALVFMGQGNIVPGSVETDSLSISNSAHVSVLTYNLFVTNSLALRGDSINNPARLTLQGGTQVGTALNVGTITLGDNSIFEQDPSTTTEISSSLDLQGGQYLLTGGLLEGPSVGVGANATFSQLGGTNLVHGVLSITGTYGISGSSPLVKLAADGIFLRGSLLLGVQQGSHSVVNFTNNGLIDLGGRMGIGVTNVSGGQAKLSANAVIDFINTPARINFAASSAVAWTPGTHLFISDWNNSGSTRVFFGNNASALSASQLAQIIFTGPVGFAPGNYPAQLLSTGELVPAPLPTLQAMRFGSALVLTWPAGFQLLSATNVTGPYMLVSGASSPRTNSLTKPQEFFRLQSF